MASPSQTDLEAGAHNLLASCARARAGERLLLVGEAGEAPYFDPAVCEAVASVARRMGLQAEVMCVAPVAGADAFPAPVRDAMARSDLTVFFSRLGDQVRFSLAPGRARALTAYTLDRGYLAGPFATTDFGLMKRLHDALLERVLGARTYRLTGACGTDLRGQIRHGAEALAAFAVDLFPVMIFPPMLCDGMEGTLSIPITPAKAPEAAAPTPPANKAGLQLSE